MQRLIENYTDEHFDVIVVGGGITGASVAYEAATRGLKVALLEMKDFSWATSAATSKLIHGGMRYLANGEIRLVRESLRERRVLENIAPNFVYPMPAMMTHNSTQFKNNKRVVKVGMLMYDLLSYDKNFTWDRSKKIPMHKTISRREVIKREPNVRTSGLTGASIFYDCTSIFPERLTLAFIKSAVAYGAKVSNYTRVDGFLINDRQEVTGVQAKDLFSGATHAISGTMVINCGGPWADILLGVAKSDTQSCILRRSEGIHVITDRKLLSGKYVVGSMTPSGRHFFLIPWRGHTLIGTTDKSFTGNPDEYRVTRQSIDELLAEVNASFGDGTLSFADVRHTFGGLRPLVEDQTEETYVSSRRYEIFDNAEEGLNGLLTVEGGKYTTSRRLAENCLKIVAAKLKLPRVRSITAKHYLAGSEIRDMDAFVRAVHRDNKDFSGPTLEYLSRNYGTEYAAILELAREDSRLADTLNADGEILAQVTYAIRQEMALTLSDIVMRRTGIGTLGNPGKEVLQKVAAIAARELNWDAGKIKQEISDVNNLLKLPED
ncbi:MAG: glycerol-3-phosphate dehydrogenase [Deltaproteobacteria bacterium HGW-Deltaproteobacteria-12]|jgi:glycerol-3-phosphate dehydrogenase|nr:MAG: glycerol-3-phosphate dehydrogenase [Deltaproteobacteria bacterium HGW-Deltaproteobacteria-12]